MTYMTYTIYATYMSVRKKMIKWWDDCVISLTWYANHVYFG